MTTRVPRAAIRRRGRVPARAVGGAALLLLLAACGKDERTVDVTDVRERRETAPAATDASTAERFRFTRDGQEIFAREAEAQAKPAWEWRTPAGWTETGGGQFREMGWTVAAAPDVQVTFSRAGGGTLANVNRWRGQMGLPETDAAAVAALEKRPFLGRQAVFVDLTGTFSGGPMTAGGGKPVEGARMLGLIVDAGGTSAFLKMTGSAAGVEAERERFLALAASVSEAKPEAPTDPHAGLPPPPSPHDAAPAPAPFRWTEPEGWVRQGDRSMRIATFKPRDAKEAEVVVSRFAGTAGGLFENLKRWRDQMGKPPLTEAEIAALPRAKALGRTAVFVSIDGDYGGMDAAEGKRGWTFLGAVIEGEQHSVFVKLVGPTAEVRPEERRFREFVESFRE
jgi:hypothetical protein